MKIEYIELVFQPYSKWQIECGVERDPGYIEFYLSDKEYLKGEKE